MNGNNRNTKGRVDVAVTREIILRRISAIYEHGHQDRDDRTRGNVELHEGIELLQYEYSRKDRTFVLTTDDTRLQSKQFPELLHAALWIGEQLDIEVGENEDAIHTQVNVKVLPDENGVYNEWDRIEITVRVLDSM